MENDAQAKAAPTKRSGGGRRSDARELGRVVRRYLGALEASRSSRGKRRTVEGITARLLKIDEQLVSADPLLRLHLTQERIDLHAELVRISNGPELDLSSSEKDFVRVAKQYGELTGVTYAAWRQVGVETEVLEQAGIQRVVVPRPDASRVRRPDGPASTDGGTARPPVEPALELDLDAPAEPAVVPEPEAAAAGAPVQPEPARTPKADPTPAEVPAAEPAPEAAEAEPKRRKRIAE